MVTAGSVIGITWKLTQTLEDLDYSDICLLSLNLYICNVK
jgi:hypothetical protein